MDLLPGNEWLLLGIVAILAFWAGRKFQSSRHREAPRESPSELYFRGLSFLLSDEPDRAIEEFTKVVRLNSETVEIYLSLGNLFRQKGEVGRAIRIHQNIIARPTLSNEIRTAALFALAEDYRKGGFVDRAVDAYRQVLTLDSQFTKALEGLLNLHENEGRWEEALNVLGKLEQVTRKADPPREAHLRLKVGRALLRNGDRDGAMEQSRQAIKVFPGCVEAYRLLGEEEMAVGKVRAAIKTFSALKKTRPSHFFLLVDNLRQAYEQLNDEKGFEACMQEAVDVQSASPPLISFWSDWLIARNRIEEAVTVLSEGLRRHPGSSDLARLLVSILARQERWREAEEVALQCLEHLTSHLHNYQCHQCGFRSRDIYWKCPQCQHWDTLERI